jgi:hypothetical protein
MNNIYIYIYTNIYIYTHYASRSGLPHGDIKLGLSVAEAARKGGVPLQDILSMYGRDKFFLALLGRGNSPHVGVVLAHGYKPHDLLRAYIAAQMLWATWRGRAMRDTVPRVCRACACACAREYACAFACACA